MKFFGKPIPIREFKFALAIAVLLNALFGAWIALWHLDFLQVDLAGHLYSSVQFGRGLFHRFSDQIFLGYIHDLFYPPLEDALLFLTRCLLGGDLFFSYQAYIALLILFYFFCLWKVIHRFQNKIAASFSALAMLYLVDLQKIEMLKLQGLSLIDLFVTGLSSETLAFGFFLLLISQTLSHFPNPKSSTSSQFKTVLLLTLTLLSHIVIGGVALLWMGCQILRAQRPQKIPLLQALVMSLGLTAFYWIPFAWHKQYVPTASIFVYAPWFALCLATTGFVFSIYKKNGAGLSLFGLAALLLSTSALGATFSSLAALMPLFHYYRLSVVGYFLVAIGISLLLENSDWNFALLKDRPLKFIYPLSSLLLSMLFMGHLISQFGLQEFNFSWTSFTPTTVDYSQVGKIELPEYGRYLVLGDDRAADIGLDSLLAARYEDFRSTKGLFWESSRTNNLQSSFLASLLTPPVVLDFYYADDFDCEIQKCLLEQAFQYYNVKGVIGNPRYLSYLKKEKRECWQDILTVNGTSHFQFHRTGEMRVSGRIYPIFQNQFITQAHLPTNFSTDVVVPIDKNGIRTAVTEKEKQSPYSLAIDEADKSCLMQQTAELHLLAKDKDWPQILNFLNAQEKDHSAQNIKQPITFRKISNQTFKIQLPKESEHLYAIKLAPQPGVQAFASGGELIPVFETYPYLVIYGAGEVTLEFGRTNAMFWSDILSGLTVIAAIFLFKKKKEYAERT